VPEYLVTRAFVATVTVEADNKEDAIKQADGRQAEGLWQTSVATEVQHEDPQPDC